MRDIESSILEDISEFGTPYYDYATLRLLEISHILGVIYEDRFKSDFIFVTRASDVGLIRDSLLARFPIYIAIEEQLIRAHSRMNVSMNRGLISSRDIQSSHELDLLVELLNYYESSTIKIRVELLDVLIVLQSSCKASVEKAVKLIGPLGRMMRVFALHVLRKGGWQGESRGRSLRVVARPNGEVLITSTRSFVC